LSGKAKRVDNLTKVFAYSVDSWDTLLFIGTLFLRTAFWNNTSGVWGTDSLTIFNDQIDYMKNQMIPNFTRACEYDMGNYTNYYVDIMTKV
jgi:hypothetical protein